MQPDRYRAYAHQTAESRRIVDGEKANIDLEIEDVVAEGDCVDGVAEFDAGDTVVSKVAFYAGDPDEEVCVGTVEIDADGEIHAELPADE